MSYVVCPIMISCTYDPKSNIVILDVFLIVSINKISETDSISIPECESIKLVILNKSTIEKKSNHIFMNIFFQINPIVKLPQIPFAFWLNKRMGLSVAR